MNVVKFFEDLHRMFQTAPQLRSWPEQQMSAEAFVRCKTQVQVLNISVKFEGLRH